MQCHGMQRQQLAIVQIYIRIIFSNDHFYQILFGPLTLCSYVLAALWTRVSVLFLLRFLAFGRPLRFISKLPISTRWQRCGKRRPLLFEKAWICGRRSGWEICWCSFESERFGTTCFRIYRNVLGIDVCKLILGPKNQPKTWVDHYENQSFALKSHFQSK